jgi:hypothetical protein
MRRISSKLTYFYKRVFPALWFGAIALTVAAVVVASGQLPPLPFLIVPGAIALFGYFVMDKLVFDLVDEVLDDKEALIIKNGRAHERVDLRDVVGVGFMRFANPPRITLHLRKKTSLGSRVSFCAPMRIALHSASPIAKELAERIDRSPD